VGAGSRQWDFAVAWEWPYDDDFVARLATRCAVSGRTFLSITADNLTASLAELMEGGSVRVLLDRASDADQRFLPLQRLVEKRGGKVLNRDALALWSSDKTTMHMEFLSHGVNVPNTVLLPPYASHSELAAEAIAGIGSPFYVKPASFGGGEGVRVAGCIEEAQEARRQYPLEKYLLQERVLPRLLDGRRAWFRPLHCCGDVHLLWWDDRTHLYTAVTSQEEALYGLSGLRQVSRQVAEVSLMDFFTTEVCMVESGRLVAVDYVNTPCDMRLQSRHAEGVPDAVVDRVVESLVCLAAGEDTVG